MKKRLIPISALLILSVLTGCGKKEPVDDGKYRVRLFHENGQKFTHSTLVQWCDDANCFPLTTDENGVAAMELEPSNYDIHLFNYPDTYAYEVGAYKATPKAKKVDVTMHTIKVSTSGDGSSANPFNVTEGVYNATVSETDELVYFAFRASKPGSYKVSSWTEDIDSYFGYFGNNDQYLVSYENLAENAKDDDSGHATNFSYEIKIGENQFETTGEIDKDRIPILKEDENGNYNCLARHIFAVSAKNLRRAKTFPIAIQYNGEYHTPEIERTVIEPKETLSKFPNNTNSALKYKDATLAASTKVFYNETDKFYHIKSVDGPTLLAKINVPTTYIDVAFSELKYVGGRKPAEGEESENIMYTDIILSNGTKIYTSFIDAYSKVCNDDGMYGVTNELKIFLEEYFESQKQWINLIAGFTVDSEYGWLFACGYYAEEKDFYPAPEFGDGSEEDPYIISENEYFTTIEANKVVYYSYAPKRSLSEQIVCLESSDSNAKLVYGSTSYGDASGFYKEEYIGVVNALNSPVIIFGLSTKDGTAKEYKFKLSIKEVTVEGNEITVGTNTLDVAANGEVVCTFTAVNKGIYTISSTETNAYIMDADNNFYNGQNGKISFTADLESNEEYSFTIYTVDGKKDYITVVIEFSPVAALGRNMVSIDAWEEVTYKFIAKEAGSYKLYSNDTRVAIAEKKSFSVSWKYGGDNEEPCVFNFTLEEGQEFVFLVTSANFTAEENLVFFVEKTA